MKFYFYVIENFGEEWWDLLVGLFNYLINVFFEDYKNFDLLFVGNDIGVFYMFDRG